MQVVVVGPQGEEGRNEEGGGVSEIASVLALAEDHDRGNGNAGGSSSSRMGKMTAGQLHKAIMDMLKSVHPSDTVTFACLISCVADLCFHGQHYAQMPNIDLNIDDGMSEDSCSRLSRRVVFGPVHASLRQEVEQYVQNMLTQPPDPSLAPPSSPSSSPPSQPPPSPVKKNKVVIVDPFFIPFFPASNPRNHVWLATALTILTREFVAAACQPALRLRLSVLFPTSSFSSSCSLSHHLTKTERTKRSQNQNQEQIQEEAQRHGRGNSRGSFLVSLAKMMSLSIEYDEEQEEQSEDDTLPLSSSSLSSSSSVESSKNSKNIQKDRSDGGGSSNNNNNHSNSILCLMKLRVEYTSRTSTKSDPSEKIQTLSGGSSEDIDDENEKEEGKVSDHSWTRFQLSASTLQLLAAVLAGGLPALFSSNSPAFQASNPSTFSDSNQTLRYCLFIAGKTFYLSPSHAFCLFFCLSICPCQYFVRAYLKHWCLFFVLSLFFCLSALTVFVYCTVLRAACCASPWSHFRELHQLVSVPFPSYFPSPSIPPSADDVLRLTTPLGLPEQDTAGGAVGGSSAEHVSTLLAALGTHMCKLQQQQHPPSNTHTHIPSEEMEAWVQLLVTSSQLVCWALLDMHRAPLAASLASTTPSTTPAAAVTIGGVVIAQSAPISPAENHPSFAFFITMLHQTRVHLFGLLRGCGDVNNDGDVALKTR